MYCIQNNIHLHSKSRDASCYIQCPHVDGFIVPHLEYVLQQCTICSIYIYIKQGRRENRWISNLYIISCVWNGTHLIHIPYSIKWCSWLNIVQATSREVQKTHTFQIKCALKLAWIFYAILHILWKSFRNVKQINILWFIYPFFMKYTCRWIF